jgi:hypothetical protein
VAHDLVERPVRVGTDDERPRSSGARLALAGGGVTLALLTGLALKGLDGLPGLPGLPEVPWGSQQVDRSTPPLLTALEDLEEYHAATGSFQVVVDLERDDRWLPAAVSGERTTYLATGSVDAVVDLTGLDASAVTLSEDGQSATIVLPPARLEAADVDLTNSRVVSRDRGLLDRVGGAFRDSPTSERQVAALAERRLDAAAAQSDLRERAQDNTEQMLTGLARSLGVEDVVVRFDAPAV